WLKPRTRSKATEVANRLDPSLKRTGLAPRFSVKLNGDRNYHANHPIAQQAYRIGLQYLFLP
ncbi:MAG: hypothetical protein EAZ90_09925, partial [Oscillatoriales cyanobacterium]|uniref:hypothetical protein n=1 Tax=unclassified Microcoleus TaxID=2642155 RepID=UPI001D892B3E